MFMSLFVVTFVVAAAMCFLVTVLFRKSIGAILAQLVSQEIAGAWRRYLTFAIYVVGISGGVRVWGLERYIAPRPQEMGIILNADRWTLEVYRTVIETLQVLAWMLLVFFLLALIAYVIVQAREPTESSGRAAGATLARAFCRGR